MSWTSDQRRSRFEREHLFCDESNDQSALGSFVAENKQRVAFRLKCALIPLIKRENWRKRPNNTDTTVQSAVIACRHQQHDPGSPHPNPTRPDPNTEFGARTDNRFISDVRVELSRVSDVFSEKSENFGYRRSETEVLQVSSLAKNCQHTQVWIKLSAETIPPIRKTF